MTDTLLNPVVGIGSRRPTGVGRVFFCDIFNGADTNNGIDPGTPFSTITYALSQCVADRNDYIYVLDAWNEATPILVNKSTTHIIGIGCPPRPYPQLTEDGDDDPIFLMVNSSGDFVEIAGFGIGGGATSGGIEASAGDATDGAWIHHCTFGSIHSGNTPLNGILLAAGTSHRGWLIENNKFFGANASTGGTLTASGVVITAVSHQVRKNMFELCVAPALSVFGTGHNIIDNDFQCPGSAAGNAIDVIVGGGRNYFAGNRAADQEAVAGNNPFRDNAAAITTDSWVGNIWGDTITAPG